ncbi:prenyltransferase [Pseudomonas sp. F1_0610]|uniref:prenyltransferase n=1 Tax=Pseudomonas sp. F1_0610 TaxID=3114284 RepID=UPI0039C29B9B
MSASEPTIERYAKASPVTKYWVLTRPGFLVAAAVPVLLGLSCAYYLGVQLNLLTAFLSLLGMLLMQASSNVLNDYYDALNGTDAVNTERIFPFTGGSRFIQNGVMTEREVAVYGFSLLFAVGVIGLLLMYFVGLQLLWIGLVGGLLGWAYSAPPLSLNSRGLGEISVAIAFGILIPLGAALVQQGDLTWFPILAGIPLAALVANLLYINQFPDYKADKQAGKHHLVVRLGPQRARWGYLIITAFGYCVLALLIGINYLPYWAGLGFLALPFSLMAGIQLLKFAEQPQHLLKGIQCTIVGLMAHGVLLSVGLCIAALTA